MPNAEIAQSTFRSVSTAMIEGAYDMSKVPWPRGNLCEGSDEESIENLSNIDGHNRQNSNGNNLENLPVFNPGSIASEAQEIPDSKSADANDCQLPCIDPVTSQQNNEMEVEGKAIKPGDNHIPIDGVEEVLFPQAKNDPALQINGQEILRLELVSETLKLPPTESGAKAMTTLQKESADVAVKHVHFPSVANKSGSMLTSMWVTPKSAPGHIREGKPDKSCMMDRYFADLDEAEKSGNFIPILDKSVSVMEKAFSPFPAFERSKIKDRLNSELKLNESFKKGKYSKKGIASSAPKNSQRNSPYFSKNAPSMAMQRSHSFYYGGKRESTSSHPLPKPPKQSLPHPKELFLIQQQGFIPTRKTSTPENRKGYSVLKGFKEGPSIASGVHKLSLK